MNKKIKKIISYIIYCLIIISIIICFVISYTMKDFFKRDSIVPTISEYSSVINMYANRYGNKISFFPDNITNNVSDYYCIFEDSFDGYNIHYLKFTTDNNYIDNVIYKNKNDIYKKIEFKEINNYYKFIDNYFDIKDTNNAFVYILKNKNNDNNYTSGIITSKSGEIVFFYANYNIKQD